MLGVVKIILSTGKGGVGKTSIAAATAVRCAELGHRTMVLSADPAHSLSDAFEVALASEPSEIAPGLWGQQLDAQHRMAESWTELRDWLMAVVEWGGVERIEAEELLLVPGMEEVVSLVEVLSFASSGEWDVIVVDCGPTAETVRLLSLPDVLDWYVKRVFPVGRRLNRAVAPVLGKFTGLPVADDEVWGAADRFLTQLSEVRDLLTSEATTVRLVVNPQRVVVSESRRTHTYLSLFGYRIDSVLVNRVLPPEVTDPWFETLKAEQTEQLSVIDEGFGQAKVLISPWCPAEPVGVEALSQLGTALYGEVDPSESFVEIEPFSIDAEGEHRVLRIDLGSAVTDEVDLARRGDELLVAVGPYRRAIMLPGSLAGRPVVGGGVIDGVLEVTFGDATIVSPEAPVGSPA